MTTRDDDRSAGPPPRLPPDAEPWIETRAGGLFFVNALLVTPAAVVLFPLLLGGLLRGLGLVEGPSRMLDTLPMVGAYFVPRMGWLAAGAAWLVWRNLRIVDRTGPRVALAVFLCVHLGTLGYTVVRWFGG